MQVDCYKLKMKELILLTLQFGALFGLGGKIYWSKKTTWTCGVWLASEEWQNEPTEAFFVFPKQEEIQCPVSAFKERSVVASNCKRLGKTIRSSIMRYDFLVQVRSGPVSGTPSSV